MLRVGLKSKKQFELMTQKSADSTVTATTGTDDVDGDTLPTDMSDSDDSDDKHVTPECSGPHSGRLLVQEQYSMNVDHMFTLLFVNSNITLELQASKGIRDYEQTLWQPESGERTRQVSYILAQPSGALGPKDVRINETQTMQATSKPGYLYSIDTSSKNTGIPYQDNFTVDGHFCLQRVSDRATQFTYYGDVVFKKNTWGMIKSFIEKNTISGLEEHARHLASRLAAEGGGKGRRRRRADGPPQSPQPPPSLPSPRPPVPHPAVPPSNSWLGVAFTLLLLINGLLCWKLFFPDHVDGFASRLNLLGEPSHIEIDDWSSLLQQYTRRERGKQLAWRDTLDVTVVQLHRAEQALRKLIESLEPLPPLRETESENDSYNSFYANDMRDVPTPDAFHMRDIQTHNVECEHNLNGIQNKEENCRINRPVLQKKGGNCNAGNTKAENNMRDTQNVRDAYKMKDACT